MKLTDAVLGSPVWVRPSAVVMATRSESTYAAPGGDLYPTHITLVTGRSVIVREAVDYVLRGCGIAAGAPE
jgi:hypothetical protein